MGTSSSFRKLFLCEYHTNALKSPSVFLFKVEYRNKGKDSESHFGEKVFFLSVFRNILTAPRFFCCFFFFGLLPLIDFLKMVHFPRIVMCAQSCLALL